MAIADATEEQTDESWHALDTEDTLGRLDVEVAVGLSDDEAVRRRERFGPNTLPTADRPQRSSRSPQRTVPGIGPGE